MRITTFYRLSPKTLDSKIFYTLQDFPMSKIRISINLKLIIFNEHKARIYTRRINQLYIKT